MDNNIQECLVEATFQNNVLKASIYHDHMLYECSYTAPTNINVQNFATKLKEKTFTFTKKPQQLIVKVDNTLDLTFVHCCSKHWFKAGTLNDIPKIFQAYPVTHYEFGIIYYSPMVMPIIINAWNKGYRVTTRDLYPGGDNAKTMRPARTMFTKGTEDNQSKGTDWYHQYVDQDFRPFHSNKAMNPILYAKKF